MRVVLARLFCSSTECIEISSIHFYKDAGLISLRISLADFVVNGHSNGGRSSAAYGNKFICSLSQSTAASILFLQVKRRNGSPPFIVEVHHQILQLSADISALGAAS